MVDFPGGTIEPAHHHTHGDMMYVIQGEIHVTHVSEKKTYVLKPGDYLYTPGGVSHHVVYLTDCKYFYCNDAQFDGPFWDGDEKAAIKPKK
jgi:quercetin dioxygenase-like cupin family protein